MKLSELRNRAEGSYLKMKDKRRIFYKLARELGFSARESAILSGTAEKNIRELAKERDNA